MTEIASNVDFSRIFIYLPSLYAHFSTLCIIGFCQELAATYSPTFESTLFIISVCSLIAENELWPSWLKSQPRVLLYVYVSFVGIFLTNAALRLIWLPLLDSVATINAQLSEGLVNFGYGVGLDETSSLYQLAEWLSGDSGYSFGSKVIALLLSLWMLEATGKLEILWDYTERIHAALKEALSPKDPNLDKNKLKKGKHGRVSKQDVCDLTRKHSDVPDIQWDEDTD